MIELKVSFLLQIPREKAWNFFSDFDRFALCIPTLKSYQLLDATRAEGKVGVKLGIVPVESRVFIEVKEKRAPECIQVEGISYLGETIVDQIRHGEAGNFDREAVGKFQLHLDLREAFPHTHIIFYAVVEAEGRLRKIYESIIKKKLPGMKQEFLEKLTQALCCEIRELAEEPYDLLPAPFVSPGEESKDEKERNQEN